ncbi:MAG: hypothetical protein WA902_22375 [Thermosynechococcaceae cyanobacterium]
MESISEELSSTISETFLACSQAIADGMLIHRASAKDKEFHFQNWFQGILDSESKQFDEPGRNTYPDFRLVHHSLGYEIKGLGFPGRVNDYDCNSQIPHGVYRGRQIAYVFGRYPSKPEGSTYPVIDLVICHGSFLNANDEYVHKNKSIRGLGSYGDILLRDRKMYVAPTPFGLLEGVERQVTLILPTDWPAPDGLAEVGQITRTEAQQKMTGYQFDLTLNELTATWGDNPTGGTTHEFVAYRHPNYSASIVKLKAVEMA